MCNIYKKQSALIAIFMAVAISVGAQTYTDTVAPFSGRKAFRTWSIGINGGAMFPAIAWGGSNNFTNPEITLGYGANIKYQAAHWFAVQLDFLRGKLKGNQDHDLKNISNNPVVAFPNYRNVREFKTDLHAALSLSGVFTLGNINWLVKRSKVIPYVSLGAGMAWYEPRITARRVGPGGTYTVGPPLELYKSNGEALNHLFIPIGMGFKFNLSRSLNLDLGYRAMYFDTDDLDGYDYADTRNGPTDPGQQLHKDKASYAFVGLEFVLGNKAKPQLMFDNPAYRMNSNLQNQIDVLRSQLNLADTDGDGVADIFDKEPNTPAGCPVDTHGVTKDTDGDGVPDCKDQQLITPTECQPVDANGVGKCPPPECCSQMKAVDSVASCNVGDLPSLSFKGTTATLSADIKAMLASVAGRLKGSPTCTITITGYPAASKASQAVCNKRTDAIRTYLMNNEGISADRLSVNCEVGGGDANTIDLKVK